MLEVCPSLAAGRPRIETHPLGIGMNEKDPARLVFEGKAGPAIVVNKALAEKLGVDIEFTVINWDNKIMELDSKAIDVVWNGMTLTDEVKNSMECTNPYFNNAQVVVTKAAE